MRREYSIPGLFSVIGTRYSLLCVIGFYILNLDNIESWRQFQQAAYAHNLDPHVLAMYQNTNFTSNGNGSTRRKNATRETTSMLKAWLNEHRKNPYPTKGEKIMLAIITKMSLTQVSTWFANARRRLKKENKVTWAIRTCPNDGDDDLDSIPDDEEPNLDENLDEVERLSCDKSDNKKRPHSPNDKSSFEEVNSKYSKRDHDRKIWSLVEMTQKEEEEKSPKYRTQREQMTSTPISKPFYSADHPPKPDITSWLNSTNQRNNSHPQPPFLPPPPSAFFSSENNRLHQFPLNLAECPNRDFPPSQPNNLMPPISMSSLLVAASAMNNMMNFDNLLPNDLKNSLPNEKIVAEKCPYDSVPNSLGKFEAMLKNSMRQSSNFDYKQIFNNRPKTTFNQSNMLSAFKNPVGLSKHQDNS